VTSHGTIDQKSIIRVKSSSVKEIGIGAICVSPKLWYHQKNTKKLKRGFPQLPESEIP